MSYKCLHAQSKKKISDYIISSIKKYSKNEILECALVLENDLVFGIRHNIKTFPLIQINEFIKTIDNLSGYGEVNVYGAGPRKGDYDCIFEADLGEEFNEGRKIFKDMGGEEELFIKDKTKYIKEFEFNELEEFLGKMVQCEYCESVFPFEQYKVSTGIKKDVVRCAHYPDCRGRGTDFTITKRDIHVNPEINEYREMRKEHESFPDVEVTTSGYVMDPKKGLSVLTYFHEQTNETMFYVMKKQMYEILKPQIRIIFSDSVKEWDLGHICAYKSVCPIIAIKVGGKPLENDVFND
jgi:hypothetical protein